MWLPSWGLCSFFKLSQFLSPLPDSEVAQPQWTMNESVRVSDKDSGLKCSANCDCALETCAFCQVSGRLTAFFFKTSSIGEAIWLISVKRDASSPQIWVHFTFIFPVEKNKQKILKSHVTQLLDMISAYFTGQTGLLFTLLIFWNSVFRSCNNTLLAASLASERDASLRESSD